MNKEKHLYNDDLDFTTNAPSYYEALARFTDSLRLLTERMNDVEEHFKKLVLEWLEDGTLAGLLEQVILDGYATEGYVNNSIDVLENKIKEFTTVEINKLTVEINNVIKRIDNIENNIEELFYFKNKTNKKLNNFIININEFTGTDTEKIQSALNKARDKNGGIVYVPSGDYTLKEELIIYGNTTLLSEHGTVYNRDHNGYMLMNGVRGKNYREYEGHGNIKIINGVFDGKAQNDLGQGTNIIMAHADNILFDGVTISNANSHHLEINSSRNVVIRNCKFLGLIPSRTVVEALQLDLATKGGFPAYGEYDSTPCKNVHIHNNVFDSSKELPSVGRGIGTHATRIGAFMENIIIENNVFNNVRDWAIQLLCYKDSTIRNNTFNKCKAGIICYPSNPENPNHTIDIYGNVTTLTQPCKNIDIKDNTFNQCAGKQLIYSYGREKSMNYDFKISGNKIFNCSDVSGVINSRATYNMIITDNNIDNVGSFPILVTSQSKHVKVINNKISNSFKTTGIRATSDTYFITITDNTLSRIGGNGIELLNNINNSIISNNIILSVNTLDEGYHGIYAHSGGSRIILIGNILRVGSGASYDKAIYITNTVNTGIMSSNVSDKGNDINKYVATELTDVNNI